MADTNDDGLEDTGPVRIGLRDQLLAMASALGRATGAIDGCSYRLGTVETKLDQCVEKLNKCPIHAEAMTALIADVGTLKKTDPVAAAEAALTARQKILDQAADAKAAKAKRWLPVIVAALPVLGGGAGAGIMKVSCNGRNNGSIDNAALIRILREEQAKTRETLKTEPRQVTSSKKLP